MKYSENYHKFRIIIFGILWIASQSKLIGSHGDRNEN